MGVIITIISVVWNVFKIVWVVGTYIHDYIIRPIEVITSYIEQVNKLIEGYQKWIQNQLNIILDLTGITPFVELLEGLARLKDNVDKIINGEGQYVAGAIAELYRALTGTSRDIIHFVTQALKPAFEQISTVKESIEILRRDTFRQWNDDLSILTDNVKHWNNELARTIRDEIEIEIETFRAGINGELEVMNFGLDATAFVQRDLSNFIAKYVTTLEL